MRARRTEDIERSRAAIDQALEIIGHGIANLRALITDLRPASLDELGPEPALSALVTRCRAHTGLEIALDVDLAYEQGRTPNRHTPDLELVIYRLVQEALNNVAKHAHAKAVRVRVVEHDAERAVLVEVHDDGRGFDPSDASEGFGLVGMRERVAAVGGSVAVESSPGEGTRLWARLPVTRRDSASDGKRVASSSFGS